MAQASQGNDDRASAEVEEREKYELMWELPQYRQTSPAFHRFFDEIRDFIPEGQSVIEFGCGPGRALEEIAKTNPVVGIDIAHNCLSVDVPFVQACLWNPMSERAEYGFCVDVMEHIPPEFVDDVFREIMACVPRCYFIACVLDDHLGPKHIGKQLHLTIRNADWWKETAGCHGTVSQFRSSRRAAHFILEK